MVSTKILNNMKKGSFIRAMFEEGERLVKIHGKENVYDFSIGNPDYEPPKEVLSSILKYASQENTGIHRYMNNAGHLDVREKLAVSLAKQTDLSIDGSHLVMVCGAAAGLNVVFKTILNPEDEVVIFAPYFVEYLTYVDNHGGKSIIVQPNHETMEPDLDAFEKSITKKTKVVIINSPNNPTGIIYNRELLTKLANILTEKEKVYGTEILVISDEPYNKLVYDNIEVPNVFTIFQNVVIVNSYSKSLALPGERIGYIAASPNIKQVDQLVQGLVFCNRTLGFVNAPSLFQKVAGDCGDFSVNTDEYKKRRDFLYENLRTLGFSCIKPQGAFYLFPKSLIENDVAFVKSALKYNLLLVPGTGFGCPGYFRISYTTNFETIQKSISAFTKLVQEYS